VLASLRWTCPTWGEPRRSTKLANDLTRTHLPTASVFIGFIWFSLMFIDFHMICIGVHWFSLISTYMIVQWCRDWGHQEPCQCDCQAWSTSKSIVEWCLLCFMGKSMSPFSGYGAMSCIGYWFSLIFIWCILIFISFHMVIDFHRFHWFSLISSYMIGQTAIGDIKSHVNVIVKSVSTSKSIVEWCLLYTSWVERVCVHSVAMKLCHVLVGIK